MRQALRFAAAGALCLATLVLARTLGAQTPSPQEGIVPIEEEPRHVLKFQNAHVRFFDVELPPGYLAKWHTHLHDGVFVNIAASATSAQDLGAQTQSRPPREPGETYFINYTKKPKAHRVANIGDAPYRVTDTEILRGCGGFSVAADAPGQSLIIDNERVRVTRIELQPGARIVLHASCGMLVAVSAGRLAFESAGPSEHVDMGPAGFKWRDAALPIAVVNMGATPFHGVDILVK